MKQLSSTLTLTLRTLAAARFMVGAGSLIVPAHSAVFFGAAPAGTTLAATGVIGRLFGVRDAVMGGYLWLALSKYKNLVDGREGVKGEHGTVKADGERQPLNGSTASVSTMLDSGDVGAAVTTSEDSIELHQLKTALWIGVICDTVDVASSLICLADGAMSTRGLVLTTAGAATFACIGSVGLRAIR